MKKILVILLSVLLLFIGALPAFAAEEKADLNDFVFSKPDAPNYFVFTEATGENNACDSLTMIRVAGTQEAMLSAEYDRDRDAFCEKYGVYEFNYVMQYDVSLDGEGNWCHTPEWDKQYGVGCYADGFNFSYMSSETIDDFTLFDLYWCNDSEEHCKPYRSAIIKEHHVYSADYEYDTYHFDTENHSLYIRCRYYMEWVPVEENGELGDKVSKFSEWSDSAVFGRNSTQIIPDEPTVYAAPVISELKIVPPAENEEKAHLTYVQTTPDETWLAGIYYIMTGEGDFNGLETQVSLNGGDWQEFDTADSGDDWCLWNGSRSAIGHHDVIIEENSHVKLRVRFNGTHGPSEWSNVLEANGGGTQELPDQTQSGEEKPGEDTKDKCALCGFCPQPLGLCIFIWIAIAAAIVVILIVVVLLTKKKKCPNCKAKVKKKDKTCPKCGAAINKN